MADDAELLTEYVERRSERAFAAIVEAHVGMVYHAAVRQLGEYGHLADDVAQQVFLAMAARARDLQSHNTLAGWLFATTRFKVSEALRSERRRKARESVAVAEGKIMDTGMKADDWMQLKPVIDEALAELGDDDRAALLLRYFEGQPVAQIAQKLGVTEAAAAKRVERAVERLREPLARRGIISAASAIGAILASAEAMAAPAGLASSITSAVMASGLPVATAGGTIFIMSTKALITVGAVAAVMIGGAAYEVERGRELAATVDGVEQQNAALAAQIARAKAAQVVEAAPRATAAPTAAVAAPAAGRGNVNLGLASAEESRAFLEANPELRQALVSSIHDQLIDEYRELMDSLSLTDAEKEQFLHIMAIGRTRIMGSYQLTLADANFTSAEYTRQLKELLGDVRYEQFRAYSRTSAQRELADDATKALYYTSTPLRPDQAEALKKVYAQAAQEEKYTVSVWTNAPDAVWEKTIAAMSDILAEPQLAVLREIRQESKFYRDQSTARGVWDLKQKAAAK